MNIKHNHTHAVADAGAFFKSLGYEVRSQLRPSDSGPDITIISDDHVFRIEVLTVNRRDGTTRTSNITDKRRSDDYVYISFDVGKRIIMEMDDYLTKCNNDGTRTVTAYDKLML